MLSMISNQTSCEVDGRDNVFPIGILNSRFVPVTSDFPME